MLRLDPRAVVEPLEQDHMQLTLIEPDRSLDDLIPIGLTNRPELAGQQAMVQAAIGASVRRSCVPSCPSSISTAFRRLTSRSRLASSASATAAS